MLTTRGGSKGSTTAAPRGGSASGKTSTGVGVFEADNYAEAYEIVSREPVTTSGLMQPDLRPFALG